MSKFKDKNYYQVSGWMVNRLKLRGNNLLVYAVIYGFSQDGETKYNGSLRYMKDATGASKNTVLKSLKELSAKGLIVKEEEYRNDVKLCNYSHNEQVVQKLDNPIIDTGIQKLHHPCSVSALGGGAEIGHNNNILDNNINNKESVSLFKNQEIENLPQKVLSYLNKKKGLTDLNGYKLDTNGKYISKLAKKHTFNDFKKVIDCKFKQWNEKEKTRKWLRPSTLFGEKFNEYLVEANENDNNNSSNGSNNFKLYNSDEIQML